MARQTLLLADVGHVCSLDAALAAGGRHHVVRVDQPEQAILKVFGTVYPAAVKLRGGEQREERK